MILKRTLVATLIATTFSGCANMQPRSLPDTAMSSPTAAASAIEADWSEPAVRRDGRPSVILITPMAPPKELKDKPVSLAFESGTTVKDVVAVLANLGYSIMLGDEKIGEKEFYLPRYKGTLGGLMAAISRTADVWFTWHDGVIVVNGKERIMLSVPQDEGLADKMTKGLTSLGVTGEDAVVSFSAGMMTAEVKPSQLNKVKAFLERITANAALVTMQVAVVTVNMNQSTKQGVDWSKMQMAIGKNNDFALKGLADEQNGAALGGATTTTTTTTPVSTPATTTPTGTGTAGAVGTPTTGTTGTTTTTVDAASLADKIGNTVLLGGTSLRAVATNNLFSLVGFVDFLNNYGLTETKQNVVLKTVTGNEVKLKSVTQIPYVSSVNVTTTAGSAGNNSLLGGTTTATANDGLTLNMTPSFDAYSNTVTVKMDLSIQAVVGFNNLSAGSQLGSLSQPTTAERSFNDIIRVRPGQTVVVGGITYDSIGDSRSAPSFMVGTKAEHKDLTVNRLTMFIVVRPTITVLGAMAEKEATDLYPDAADAPATPTVVKASNKAGSKSKKTSAKE